MRHKVLLIDDEPLAKQLIRSLLNDNEHFEVVGECCDGFEGFKAIQEYQPDLVFLDVQMPRLNGFEMLELLDNPPAVVFCTAFDEFAMKAFETHAVDYLLKPISQARFDQSVEKFLAGRLTTSPQVLDQVQVEWGRKTRYWERILVKQRHNIKVIPVEDIHFLKADDDYIQIVTHEGSFLKKETMTHCEQRLDPRLFVRVHRSFIVHIQQIDRLEPYEKENYIALLKSGEKVSISRTGYAKLKQVLGM